ncbi:MAG: cytochrome c peroxidase [Phycisphaeraceae bacterium]
MKASFINTAALATLALILITTFTVVASGGGNGGGGGGGLRELYAQPVEQWPEPHVDEGIGWQEFGHLPRPPHPEDNPHSDEKAELGKLLFFDGRLSATGQMACISCHAPELGWADGRTTSLGHSVTALRRNAPSIANAAHFDALFWDGRGDSIEQQVELALLNVDEMRGSRDAIVDLVRSSTEYRDRFAEAFAEDPIQFEHITKAIATYVRTVNSGRSDFDRFLNGETDRLTDAELRGLHLFRTKARCMNCHHGPLLSDGEFHDLGLSYYGRRLEDLGRYRITDKPEDVGRFRTPSLRNVTRTAPYMHNGLFGLEGVINMYNAGMATLRPRPEQENDPLFPTKSPLLKPLDLDRQEMDDLMAFLESLQEPRRRVRQPELPAIDQTQANN